MVPTAVGETSGKDERFQRAGKEFRSGQSREGAVDHTEALKKRGILPGRDSKK